MAYRRRRFVRLDQLVIGARPDLLWSQDEIPAVTPAAAAPLSDAEELKLSHLRLKLATVGRLEPAERYTYQQLCARPRRSR